MTDSECTSRRLTSACFRLAHPANKTKMCAFFAKRILTECCVCNDRILWKKKKKALCLQWRGLSAALRSSSLQLGMFKRGTEIGFFVFGGVQPHFRVGLLLKQWRLYFPRTLWTEMRAALNASVCVASVCGLFMPFLPPLLPHTHIYTHPAARSWPLGYHEFHSNGSRCDHVSFISLIRCEHDKPDQIVWGRKRRISNIRFTVLFLSAFFFFLAFYQLLTDAFKIWVNSSVSKQGLIWWFHFL